METTGISLGDAMNLCNSNGGYNNMWNNPFMYLVWLSMFNGNNGFGNNRGGAEIEAAKADIIQNTQAVNDAQTLSQQIRGIANGLSEGLSSSTYALNNALKDNTFNLTTAIGNVGNNMQMGFCNVNHNIDNLKYENAKNTADIITNATANTQRIMDGICSLKMDAKDAQIAHLAGQLADAKLNLSQVAQNAYLVEKLKPTT